MRRLFTSESQAEFAERVGLALKTYGNYERKQRELPQAARLAIIDRTDTHPLPTEALFVAARGEAMDAADGRSTKTTGSEHSGGSFAPIGERFAKTTIQSRRGFCSRSETMPSPRRRYMASLMCTRNLKIPLGIPQPAADWLLVLSFAIVLMLFVPVISDLPAAKVVRHMRGRVSSRRRLG